MPPCPINASTRCVAGAQIVTALQTIASRAVDPLDSCVVSVTHFHAGTVNNVIPNRRGTQRHRAHA